MQKQNPKSLSLKKKSPVGRGAASQVPQPRGISDTPSWTEDWEEDLCVGHAPRGDDQWLDFLERVKSEPRLEEEALWGEAKVFLASLEPEPEACGRPGHEWAEEHAEVTLRRLPQEWCSWLGERGLQKHSQVVALAEAYLWRQQESWRWESQMQRRVDEESKWGLPPPSSPNASRTNLPPKCSGVFLLPPLVLPGRWAVPVAAGSSSSTVQRNPPDPRQEADGQQSRLAGLMPDCGKEEDHPGVSVERGEDEALVDWESTKGQEGNNPTEEEEMDQWMPCLGGAFKAPEQQAEGSGDRSPGTQSSTDTQEEPRNAFAPSSTPGRGTLSRGRKRHQCLECGKSFARRHHLTSHEKIHTGEKPHQCAECEKSFRQKGALRRHQRIHTGEKSYKCSTCDRSFRHKESLQRHKKIHTGQRPYKCGECEKSFRHKANLQRHQKIHRGEKSYKCSKCDKSFQQKATLQQHNKIHSGEKSYKCSMCDKSFRYKGALQQHQKIHTGEKSYKCSKCDKSFRHKGVLQRHKGIHTDERPYKCAVCEKSFRRIETLQRHQKIHTGEKSYKCAECEKSFTRRDTLQQHQKIHHKNAPSVAGASAAGES